jgi:hypothetical protein
LNTNVKWNFPRGTRWKYEQKHQICFNKRTKWKYEQKHNILVKRLAGLADWALAREYDVDIEKYPILSCAARPILAKFPNITRTINP